MFTRPCLPFTLLLPIALVSAEGCAPPASTAGSESATGDVVRADVQPEADVASPCAEGLSACGASCVDLQTDGNHCGDCTRACVDASMCSKGDCVPLPSSCDAGCPSGSHCAQTTNTCVAGCVGDANCGAGQICLGNQCVVGCDATVTCPLGQVCDANHCRDACHDDLDCPLDQRCHGGTLSCVPGCNGDERCAAGEICDSGTCRIGCRHDTDCDAAQVCDAGTRSCRAGCRRDDDCKDGEICDGTLSCRPGCRSDSACPLGQLCDFGELACVSRCEDDFGCPRGQVCDDSQCHVGCHSDEDCVKVGATHTQVCDDHTLTCHEGCRFSEQCAEGEFCDRDTLTCLLGCGGGDCPLGQICVDAGLADNDCGGARCCSAHGCSAAEGCGGRSLGEYLCLAPDQAAAEATVCRIACLPQHVPSDCPGGQICVMIRGSFSDPAGTSGIDWACAKYCTSNADCATTSDVSNRFPLTCTCANDGVCREPHGSTACAGNTVDWGL